MGILTTTYFQDWMFYFIEEIVMGKTRFNWAGMISNCLHEQFVVVKKTSQFYMNSYLVYLLTDPIPYRCLFFVQSLTPRRELKVYDRKPQIQYHNFKKYYCRVNDAFIRHIIRLLRVDFERLIVPMPSSTGLDSYLSNFLNSPKSELRASLRGRISYPGIRMTGWYC